MRLSILALLVTVAVASLPAPARADLRQLTAPYLGGLTLDQANAKLKKAGFLYAATLGDTTVHCAETDKLAAGTVYCQDPAPEQQVFENKMFIVKMYTPPPPLLTGMKLVGMTLDEAKKQLAAWKHTGGIQTPQTSGDGLLSDERKIPPCAPEKVCDVVPWEFRPNQDITLKIGRKTKITAPD